MASHRTQKETRTTWLACHCRETASKTSRIGQVYTTNQWRVFNAKMLWKVNEIRTGDYPEYETNHYAILTVFVFSCDQYCLAIEWCGGSRAICDVFPISTSPALCYFELNRRSRNRRVVFSSTCNIDKFSSLGHKEKCFFCQPHVSLLYKTQPDTVRKLNMNRRRIVPVFAKKNFMYMLRGDIGFKIYSSIRHSLIFCVLLHQVCPGWKITEVWHEFSRVHFYIYFRRALNWPC